MHSIPPWLVEFACKYLAKKIFRSVIDVREAYVRYDSDSKEIKVLARFRVLSDGIHRLIVDPHIRKLSMSIILLAVFFPQVVTDKLLNMVSDDIDPLVRYVAEQDLPVLPYILSTVCYDNGQFMMVGGKMSLKKHSKNPSSEPVAKGVSKLLTGGAITSVPALTGIIQKVGHVEGSQRSWDNFNTEF